MKQRDRQRTKERILRAVGKELAKRGFQGIGVNAVARRAGVDKALIYRYFGGFDDLLRAFAESDHHWPSLIAIASALPNTGDLSPATFARQVILGFVAAVRNNRVLQEIMRWELSEKSGVADVLAARRERDALALLELAREKYPTPPEFDLDMAAVSAVLVAGLTFLLLRSRVYPDYNGIALATDEGWARIERAAERMLNALLGGE